MDLSFEIPGEFVSAVVDVGSHFSFSESAIGRRQNPADLAWEEFALALARCAPAVLGTVERRRLVEFRDRSGEARYGAALAAPSAMMLGAEAGSTAL